MSIKNAKQPPQIFYGLHMAPGVAEYAEQGRDPYRILINEDTIKNMDSTFAGKPIYVHHVEEVDLDKIQEEADGYVVESFYNKCDGKHWAKFIVVSDRGHDAIRQGWKLSNAYIPKEFSGGGLWHGVEYIKEVTRGEYEHLAIVPNPRYDESVIMTPEQFKSYNGEKELELLKIANAKGEPRMIFFKREKIANSADLEKTVVSLPKSGKEMSIAELVTNADDTAMAAKEPMQMANMDHHVMVGEHKMTVNELVTKHMEACNELSALKATPDEKAEMEKKNAEKEAEAAKAAEAVKANAEKEAKDAEEKKKNAEKDAADAEEKKKNALHFEALKNANMTAIKDEPTFEMGEEKLARGKSRYGSN